MPCRGPCQQRSDTACNSCSISGLSWSSCPAFLVAIASVCARVCVCVPVCVCVCVCVCTRTSHPSGRMGAGPDPGTPFVWRRAVGGADDYLVTYHHVLIVVPPCPLGRRQKAAEAPARGETSDGGGATHRATHRSHPPTHPHTHTHTHTHTDRHTRVFGNSVPNTVSAAVFYACRR